MRHLEVAGVAATSLASLALLMLAFAPGAIAEKSNDEVWEVIDRSVSASSSQQNSNQQGSQAFHLNRDALARQLARSPMEGTADLRNSPAVLSLPMPDGSFQRFRIEESPVMDAELVARYPEIKSYRGQGIDDGTVTVRFDWTPLGFHALVLTADKAVSILPPNPGDVTTYASYYYRGKAFECGVTSQSRTTEAEPAKAEPLRPAVAVGGTLRTYRIAVAATNEFCVLLGGNTVANSTAAINSFLNGVNAIWERELSVHLNLVSAPNIVYAGDNTTCGGACTAANDPYTNGNGTMLNEEARNDFAAKVPQADYDVGHVLATGSSGSALAINVCGGLVKMMGNSSMDTPAGNSVSVGLWAHELGHQFGGSHTNNGQTANCAEPNRVGERAVEPGSGTTILSYVAVCDSDNLSGTRDLRWHSSTFAEISAFLTSGGGMTCGTSTPTGNNIPTVSAGSPFTIPRNTPFTLTATGTDADPGDVANLTFVWEQVDAGGDCPGAGCFANPPYGDQPGDPPTTTRPLFRVFPPTRDKSRTFPRLTYILNNANVPPPVVGGFQTAENLPSVSRTMNFRATVRDNRAGGGGVNNSSVVITVDGNSGPFAVSAPNGGETWSGSQMVTWNAANTSNAPVSVANVRITLSTDGGFTFPITLAASTANTGSAAVVIPNGIASSTARIKVEAIGNIFFDISDANFNVTPADTCPAVSDISPKAGNVGETVTITGVNFVNGGNVTGVRFTSNITAAFTVVNDTTITTTVPAGAAGGPITISKASCSDVQTTGYNVCPNAPAALVIDDGASESFTDVGSGGYYLNRLTPGSYPATLTQISIFWEPLQSFPPGTAINVVAGNNASGTTNIDGTTFQSFAATAGAQPGFTTFTLPNPLTISAGDFVVGFQVPANPAGANVVPIAIDTNNPVSRSYRSGGGTIFVNETGGNYMIRAAQVFTGCLAAPASGRVANVSTRLPVGTGDNVLIEGFIVQGPAGSTKKILLRALGPSLASFGITDALANPTLEIRDPANALLAMNNDWKTTQTGGLIPGDQFAEISGSSLAPSNDLESAIIASLAPGSYTAIVRGLNNTAGTGVVDGFDLSAESAAKVVNIATRGLIQPGDKLMIAGFIIQNGPVRAVVRAIGPSLAAFGITNALPDTTLQLRDQNGAIIRENDDWKTTQQAELAATTLQPTNDLEAALVQTLPPGAYTAQVRGKPETTGTGVVEVYFIE